MSAGRAGGNGRRTGLKILWTEVHAGSIPAPGTKTATRPLSRGGAVRKLVGLITRRSQVQILPPQPKRRCSSVGESMRFIPAVSVVRFHSPPPFLKNRKPENGRLLPSPSDFCFILDRKQIAGWSSQEARRAHNPKVAGSNPAPATRHQSGRVF